MNDQSRRLNQKVTLYIYVYIYTYISTPLPLLNPIPLPQAPRTALGPMAAVVALEARSAPLPLRPFCGLPRGPTTAAAAVRVSGYGVYLGCMIVDLLTHIGDLGLTIGALGILKK